MIEAWNADVPHMNAVLARQDSLITLYNEGVDHYNAMARSAYARWVLVPGVGRRRGRTDLSARADATP